MSRSVKKNPIIKDNGKGKKEEKQRANSVLRQKLKDPEYEIADGGAYQKEYDSWNIADYVARLTEVEAITYYEKSCTLEDYSHGGASEDFCNEMVEWFKQKYPTLQDFLKWWRKIYKRK